jgi:hypothetical protein
MSVLSKWFVLIFRTGLHRKRKVPRRAITAPAVGPPKVPAPPGICAAPEPGRQPGRFPVGLAADNRWVRRHSVVTELQFQQASPGHVFSPWRCIALAGLSVFVKKRP